MNRANRLSLLLLAGFLILLANLVRMQILQGDYYRARSEKNRIRVLYLEAARGELLDRNGTALATSRLSFNCSAIPREARGHLTQSCEILSGILGEDAETLQKRFKSRKPGNFQSAIVAEDITPAQAIAIEERLDSLPGFLIETRPQREYPLAEAASHLIGYVGPLNEEADEAVEVYGYSAADWVGREGVEQNYESYLRGYSGGLQIEVDSAGRIIRALGVREPKQGKDVQLTVDAGLQTHVQKLLEGQKGSVMVMELKEGGLLSINSSPSFDSNLFASRRGRREVGKYLKDETAPMVNRGLRGRYPPGSIFKIVTALAGLETDKISASTVFSCPGHLLVGDRKFPCWKKEGHGPQALTEALEHSCNVYFYNSAITAGIDALVRKTLEFGFSKPTGIDLPGEKSGFVPSRNWKRSRFSQSWYEGETANLSIGQGYLQVTPAQSLLMIAAAATDGRLFKPHVVDKIDGVKVATANFPKITSVPAADWKALRKGLEAVVNSPTGTGRLAALPDIRVAGKTGTAQSGQDKTHAWFVGFAPAENPRVAMVVFAEHGGRGGMTAGSLAGSVFKWLKEAGYLNA